MQNDGYVCGQRTSVCEKILFAVIVLTAFVFMSMPLIGFADDSDAITTFSVDGLYYEISSDRTVEVINDPFAEYCGEIMIPSFVEYEGRSYSVTCIGDSAFMNSDVTSVTIPATVTSMGSYVFFNCIWLKSVTVEGKEPAIIGTDVFPKGNRDPQINVPASAFAKYVRDWSEYSSQTEQVQTTVQLTVISDLTGSFLEYSEPVTVFGDTVSWDFGCLTHEAPIITIGGVHYTGFATSSSAVRIPALDVSGDIIIIEDESNTAVLNVPANGSVQDEDIPVFEFPIVDNRLVPKYIH